jgi:predicted ATPase
MKLTHLKASRYRSLNHVEIDLGSLNVLIGVNASGKSNVLDALRFLSEGARGKDFSGSVDGRGGMPHLAWKGEPADEVEIVTRYEDGPRRFEWTVALELLNYGFRVREKLEDHSGQWPRTLLEAKGGEARWTSAQVKGNDKFKLTLGPTACALIAACADESFPARAVGDFVQRWGFFDPSPPLLRRASDIADAKELNTTGRNLAARLYVLQQGTESERKTFEKIVAATKQILGVPEAIEFRVSDADQRVYFMQKEPSLTYRVHQVGASSGTLRMLALMTALLGEQSTSLVGIEEPENHIHPSALKEFAGYLREASKKVQIVVTTHSPLLLDCLPEPREVAVVRRTDDGTVVEREQNPEAVDKALEASGFGLGEFYETKGFGG